MGGYFSSRTMIGELVMVLVVALLLLYFILAAQFESLIQPMIILVEVVVDVGIVCRMGYRRIAQHHVDDWYGGDVWYHYQRLHSES